jgi:YD repeat-containing protein
MVRQGWSYYEKVLTGVTSVTLSGTGNIDEVRLYPTTAQMTTYTYIPQVGIQSMTDARSAATFYEYDGLQRLVIVRDDKGKILKTFQYHYKSH